MNFAPLYGSFAGAIFSPRNMPETSIRQPARSSGRNGIVIVAEFVRFGIDSFRHFVPSLPVTTTGSICHALYFFADSSVENGS